MVNIYDHNFILGTVSKHVAIVGELSRIVQDHNLLEVSETEQQMTTQASHSEVQQKVCSILKFYESNHIFRSNILHCLIIIATIISTINLNSKLSQISSLLRNPKVREMEIIRLVLLYCICYEGQSGHNPRQFIEAMRNRGISEAKCKV